MDKIIPLHSLVIVSKKYEDDFDIRLTDIMQMQSDYSAYNTYVEDEIIRRTLFHLDMGERLIIGDPGKQLKNILSMEALNRGASVFYIDDIENSNNMVEIIDPKRRSIKLISEPDISSYQGITVIGDIHGMFQPLQSVLSWCRSRKNFPIFVGDLLDYGFDTLDVVEEVYNLVMRSEAIVCIGNHERKILRWVDALEKGTKVPKISDGNKITIDALMRMSPEYRKRWIGKFRALVSNSHIIYNYDKIFVTHAAVHPVWWKEEIMTDAVEDYALFGQPDFKVRPPKFATCYYWVDEIPNDNIVVVGHDIRSIIAPKVVTGKKGGKAIFVDTGCGKKGVLSSIDFRFTVDGDLRFESMMVH